MKNKLKESHAITIFMALLFPVGAIVFHLTIVDFDELDYMKARLVEVDYKKQFITVNSTKTGNRTLSVSCKNALDAVQELSEGVELEVWYKIQWGLFKSEIWQLRIDDTLLCDYQAKQERLRMIGSIPIILSFIAWYFAFVQYRQRKQLRSSSKTLGDQ